MWFATFDGGAVNSDIVPYFQVIENEGGGWDIFASTLIDQGPQVHMGSYGSKANATAALHQLLGVVDVGPEIQTEI